MLAVLAPLPRAAEAQGFLQRVGRAAKGAAVTASDAAAEMALSNATPVNLSVWPLRVVPLAMGVGLGVTQVDILDSVGVRVHAYLENATDAPVAVRVPADSAFSLVDAEGRALGRMSRMRVDGKAGVQSLTIPAGRRVPLRLLFRQGEEGVTRATLRVGPSARVGEIPVRLAGVAGGTGDASGGAVTLAGAARQGGERAAIADLTLVPPPGWARADQKGVPIFLDPTSTRQVVSFIAVHPPVPLRGSLRDFVRGQFFSSSERLLGDFTETAGIDARDAGVWTSEKRADGVEVFRRYRAIAVGDRVALLIGTTNDFARDRAMLDHMYAVAATVTIAGRGPGAAASAEGTTPAVPPRPASKPAPTATPTPPPASKPAPAPAAGRPNFVGTYFSWGMINTKLLILANGTWETAQSKGHWKHGGGRMILLDGNARGWCGGRGILNAEETQLSFDCVSKDGFPMNVSFAKHSKEIER